MMKRRLSAITAGALALGLFLVSAPRGFASGRHLVEVTITNMTRGQILSPPVVATHTGRAAPLFAVGEPASPALAALAEDAAAGDLLDQLDLDPATVDVEMAAGPILPGGSATLFLEARHARYFSALAMLVTTNDAFIAVNRSGLPRHSGSFYSVAYDAGSEANNESCDFIPGPPCDHPHVRDLAGAEGYVHVHAGVHGIADLVPADHDWRNPVARIVVRRVRTD